VPLLCKRLRDHRIAKRHVQVTEDGQNFSLGGDDEPRERLTVYFSVYCT